jgi:outer membrane cobalamin receptor
MKQYKFCYCLIINFFLLILPVALTAQTVITGKVVDLKSRQTLDAATVTVNGTSNKAITDEHGNFIIKTAQKNITINVSHIGYKTYNAETAAKNGLLVEMQPDALKLDDIKLQSGGFAKFSSLAKIDLALKPVKNTQELMRIVPGLFIAQHAGGGKAEQIFLRGFDCDHGTDIQVSIDGMPVNMVSHAHGQGYADAHFIIPETINSIDFGTGPYYTQHGNLNTAGYVSFSTYKSIAKSVVQMEAGRFNTFRVLTMLDLLKKNKDKQSAYVAGEFNYTDGPTESKQAFNRFNVFGKYSLKISDATQFAASASAFKSKWYASGQVPERAVSAGIINRFGSIDPSEGGHTERYNVNLQSTTNLSKGLQWENQAFFNRYIFSLYSNFTFYLNDPVNGDGINQAEKRNIIGVNSKLKHQHFFGNAVLQSTEGVGLRYDATKNSMLAHQVKRQFINYVTLGDINEANAFAFTQHQLSTGNWLFDAGLRLDYFSFNYNNKLNTTPQPSQQKAIVSPKLNIQYIVNKAVQLYVKGGKGFHSNDTRVVVANSGKEILPAAYGADAGIILKPMSSLYLNIAVWYLYLNQEFVYVGDEGVVEPSGKTKRQGIDVIVRYQLNKHLFANANFNFTKPRAIGEPKVADYIPLAPTATSTGGLFYKQAKGFNGGISYRYIKNRPANEDNSIVAKGYFIMDAAVRYTKSKYEIGLALENIFNSEWNEAQFATESQLRNEPAPVTELHYTPGSPFMIRAKFAVFF